MFIFRHIISFLFGRIMYSPLWYSLSDISDDEDMVELVRRNSENTAIRTKTFRERRDHFNFWNDTEFVDRFRLSKNAVKFVLEEIRDSISRPTTRNRAVPPEIKLLLTLKYFASGLFLVVCGDFCGVHKSTASRIVREVSRAIASLKNRFIVFPTSEEEVQRTQREFYGIAKFPNCIGAMDCTHIKIQSPGGENAEIFRNRKGFFSLNVQTICDAALKITNIVARWPGSAHDSNIFSNSTIRAQFENGLIGHGSVLVADSGYAVSRYVLTILRSPLSRGELLYNESLIRTRITVERSYGVWKRRFPILSRGINLKLDRVEAVVIATAVLHNIARDMNDQDPSYDEDIVSTSDDEFDASEGDSPGADSIRRVYVAYFDQLN